MSFATATKQRQNSRSSIGLILKSDNCTPIKAIIETIKAVNSGNFNPGFDPTATYNTDFQLEQVLIGRKAVRIRKVYLTSSAATAYKVGWVVDSDVAQCMICLGEFGWTRFRHHCRACGSLVCSACSPYKSDIPFLQEEGGSRVCKNCFGLRTDIYAAPLKDDTPTRIMTQQSMAAGANGIFSPGDGRVIRRGSSTKSTTVPMDDPEVLAQIEKKLSYEYEAAYRKMRHLIPLDIAKINLQQLMTMGLPEEAAKRIWTIKVLWLICMHPDDIAKIHIADLRGKYQAHGLDIVEMRAIWHCLKSADWMTEGAVAKAEWKLGFKSKLDDMAHREAYMKLSDGDTRNAAYQGCDELYLFDPDVPINPRYDRSASFIKQAIASPDATPQNPHDGANLTPCSTSTFGGFSPVDVNAIVQSRVSFFGANNATLDLDDDVSALSLDMDDDDDESLSPTAPHTVKKASLKGIFSEGASISPLTTPAAADEEAIAKLHMATTTSHGRGVRGNRLVFTPAATSALKKPPGSMSSEQSDTWKWSVDAWANTPPTPSTSLPTNPSSRAPPLRRDTPYVKGARPTPSTEASATASESEEITTWWASPAVDGGTVPLNDLGAEMNEEARAQGRSDVDDLVHGDPSPRSRGIRKAKSTSGILKSSSRDAMEEETGIHNSGSSGSGAINQRARRSHTLTGQSDLSESGGDTPAERLARRRASYREAAGMTQDKEKDRDPSKVVSNLRTQRNASFSSAVSAKSGNSEKSGSSRLSRSSQGQLTPARLLAKFIALVGAGEATKAREVLDSSEVGAVCPRISRGEATALLLQACDDPEKLAEPLDTIALLVDDFGADPNVTDAQGRNALQILFTNSLLGRFLLSRGSDVLSIDSTGVCALEMGFEYGQDWMFSAFQATGGEAALLVSDDDERIKQYVKCLILGGRGLLAGEIIAEHEVIISPELATSLLDQCRGNFDNMKEPMETFELLERMGANVD